MSAPLACDSTLSGPPDNAFAHVPPMSKGPVEYQWT